MSTHVQDASPLTSDIPVFDVHEHHMPEILLDRDVGLMKLLQQSYAGWTQARPYFLPSETASADTTLAEPGEATWEAIAPYVEESGSNSFVRTLVEGISDLYELDGEGITVANWEELDQRVRARHATPDWIDQVIGRTKIEQIITDPYSDPMLDARETLGGRYYSVARVNALAVGWHPESQDHNGNAASAFAAALGIEVGSFDDYLEFLEVFVDTLGDRNQVALKNALAYDRDLSFDEPDEAAAREVWDKATPTPEEQKAFSDVVVDRLCSLAGERDIPVQMHLGTAIIRGSQPLRVAGLVERHPKTRFLLMHLGYPWSRDLLGMAFVYRNIWLDLCWSFLLSPSHFKLALHEAIEVLPDESRLMIGGDNWHIEETYGALKLGRRLIGEVLEEKVRDGYLRPEQARRLAERIFHENASAFFGISPAS